MVDGLREDPTDKIYSAMVYTTPTSDGFRYGVGSNYADAIGTAVLARIPIWMISVPAPGTPDDFLQIGDAWFPPQFLSRFLSRC